MDFLSALISVVIISQIIYLMIVDIGKKREKYINSIVNVLISTTVFIGIDTVISIIEGETGWVIVNGILFILYIKMTKNRLDFRKEM